MRERVFLKKRKRRHTKNRIVRRSAIQCGREIFVHRVVKSVPLLWPVHRDRHYPLGYFKPSHRGPIARSRARVIHACISFCRRGGGWRGRE
jgi:hypothetical protein